MASTEDSRPAPGFQGAPVTRRGLIGHAVGAYVLVSGLGAASPTASDPFVSFLTRWKDCDAASCGLSDDDYDAFYLANLKPFHEAIYAGRIPAATTHEGAMTALRAALDPAGLALQGAQAANGRHGRDCHRRRVERAQRP